jgi:hypothetical protein
MTVDANHSPGKMNCPIKDEWQRTGLLMVLADDRTAVDAIVVLYSELVVVLEKDLVVRITSSQQQT